MASSTQFSETFSGSELSDITSAAVREELTRILNSRHFRSSKRSAQFLSYVVEQKLQRNESLIKERTIGIEVFGRSADYATGDDPVVRVQAGEVRRRLDAYVIENRDQLELVIELPTGSYVPVIRRSIPPVGQNKYDDTGITGDSEAKCDGSTPTPEGVKEIDPSPVATSADPKHVSRIGFLLSNIFSTRIWLTALGALTLILGLSFYAYRSRVAHSTPTLFAMFWRPLATTTKPIVISLGKPLVYVPRGELFDSYSKGHPSTFTSPVDRHNRYLPLDRGAALQWSDLQPVTNSGPAVGGVRAAMQLTAVLGQLGKSFVIRFGDEASFLELRDSPAVIVGNLNNRWTNEMDAELHFRIHDNNQEQWVAEAGTTHVWKPEYGERRATDYGLITRESTGPTGQFVVKVAGMSDNGTEAASELVTNTEALTRALESLPKGWDERNLELLVETDIIGGKAGPPRLIASYVW